MSRSATIERKTAETDIRLQLEVDGSGASTIESGIPFFDHMLTLFSRHGLFDLDLKATGDIAVDLHHTVEDTGICLGQALTKALGDKKGLRRYGHAYVPMDDSLARAVVDLSGRFYLHFDAAFTRERVGDLSTELVSHFWYSFAEQLRCNLHVSVLYGTNTHHQIEAIFKAVARALRLAVHRETTNSAVPSTKGTF